MYVTVCVCVYVISVCVCVYVTSHVLKQLCDNVHSVKMCVMYVTVCHVCNNVTVMRVCVPMTACHVQCVHPNDQNCAKSSDT